MQPHRDNIATQEKKSYVLPETVALVCIGGFDLLYTIYLLATHQAREANPFMERVLMQAGPNGFILVKALFLAGPLMIAEIARRERPDFVRWALRFCIVVYVCALSIAYFRPEPRLPPPPPIYVGTGERG